MKTCVVTCTGGRPELFALCRRWVEHQTRLPDYWLVVTDNGDEIRDLPSFAEWKPVKPWDGERTIDGPPNYALHQAIKLVPRDHTIVTMEDDDYYNPYHVETALAELAKGHDVVYGMSTVQFHVPRGRWRIHDKPGASEGRVGIHPVAALSYAESLLDRPLWDGLTDGRYPRITTYGIKGVGYGLPGRPGASLCHKPEGVASWTKDKDRRVFRRCLGKDADAYLSLLQPTQDGTPSAAGVLSPSQADVPQEVPGREGA